MRSPRSWSLLVALSLALAILSGQIILPTASQQALAQQGYPGPGAATATVPPLAPAPGAAPAADGYPGPVPTSSPLDLPMAVSPSVIQLHMDLSQPSPRTYTNLTSYANGTAITNTLNFAPQGTRPQPLTTQSVLPDIPQEVSPIRDGWFRFFSTDFVGTTLPSGCQAYDRTGRTTVPYWGIDTTRSQDTIGRTPRALWPARSGPNAANPATGSYPANLDSYFECGTYPLNTNSSLLIEFWVWMDIKATDGQDRFFVGTTNSANPSAQGVWLTSNANQTWQQVKLYVDFAPNETNFSMVFRFQSDSGSNTGKGVWIDGVRFWRYTAPSAGACMTNNASVKGMVVPPYEAVGDVWVPFLRGGETRVLSHAMQANAGWVRLNFIDPAGQYGEVDLQEYDRMVDTFCTNGISVLGLVGQEAIPNVPQSWINDPAKAFEYANRLGAVSRVLARHFRNRVQTWEVFNEPNFVGVQPARFAVILNIARNEIFTVNNTAQIVYGGLASANRDSRDYAGGVYAEWNANYASVRPFNVFALHPYTPPNSNANPAFYFTDPNQIDQPGTHIITKFRVQMQQQSVGSLPIWATETGWNSAYGASGSASPCIAYPVSEYEQSVYLKTLFDQLLSPTQGGLQRVIWYQYNDVALACQGQAGLQTSLFKGGSSIAALPFAPGRFGDSAQQAAIIPWNYGLYDINRNRAKRSECAFRAYPSVCTLPVLFLPNVQR